MVLFRQKNRMDIEGKTFYYKQTKGQTQFYKKNKMSAKPCTILSLPMSLPINSTQQIQDILCIGTHGELKSKSEKERKLEQFLTTSEKNIARLITGKDTNEKDILEHTFKVRTDTNIDTGKRNLVFSFNETPNLLEKEPDHVRHIKSLPPEEMSTQDVFAIDLEEFLNSKLPSKHTIEYGSKKVTVTYDGDIMKLEVLDFEKNTIYTRDNFETTLEEMDKRFPIFPETSYIDGTLTTKFSTPQTYKNSLKESTKSAALPYETLIKHLKESAAKYYKLKEKYQTGIGHQFEYERKGTSLSIAVKKDGKEICKFQYEDTTPSILPNMTTLPIRLETKDLALVPENEADAESIDSGHDSQGPTPPISRTSTPPPTTPVIDFTDEYGAQKRLFDIFNSRIDATDEGISNEGKSSTDNTFSIDVIDSNTHTEHQITFEYNDVDLLIIKYGKEFGRFALGFNHGSQKFTPRIDIVSL